MSMNKIKLGLILVLLSFAAVFVFALQENPRELGEIKVIHYLEPEGKVSMMSFVEGPCYGADFWSDISQGPMEYIINPTNDQDIPDEFIFQTFYDSTQIWDNETDADLYPDYIYVNRFIQGGNQDWYNVVSFGDLPSNILAVTDFWYWVDTKEIVEWDMIFNLDYLWGDAELDSSVFDFKEIAVHELGHTLGFMDIYQPACSYVTMYGYSSNGETYKRTLEPPDIFILQKIYGGKADKPILKFGIVKTKISVS